MVGLVVWGGYELFKPAPSEEPEDEESTIEDEFTDWKTYRNEEWSFEIKYPEDWFVRKCGSLTGFSDRASEITSCGEGHGGPIPLINISITVDANSIEKHIDWYEEHSHSLSIEQIELDNQPATRTISIIKADENSQRPELDKVEQDSIISTIDLEDYPKFNTIELSYVKLDLVNRDYSLIFNQILSTFKFIE